MTLQECNVAHRSEDRNKELTQKSARRRKVCRCYTGYGYTDRADCKYCPKLELSTRSTEQEQLSLMPCPRTLQRYVHQMSKWYVQATDG
ncbi:unnamed protein product [Clavelina lepadiformis]|uniref:Uncharacterized protein n=1 Tax=Clavelina lepadiformis TaxID=159417 RepID=A0ABP0GTR3_CLALP